jgi:hypothetical protein
MWKHLKKSHAGRGTASRTNNARSEMVSSGGTVTDQKPDNTER